LPTAIPFADLGPLDVCATDGGTVAEGINKSPESHVRAIPSIAVVVVEKSIVAFAARPAVSLRPGALLAASVPLAVLPGPRLSRRGRSTDGAGGAAADVATGIRHPVRRMLLPRRLLAAVALPSADIVSPAPLTSARIVCPPSHVNVPRDTCIRNPMALAPHRLGVATPAAPAAPIVVCNAPALAINARSTRAAALCAGRTDLDPLTAAYTTFAATGATGAGGCNVPLAAAAGVAARGICGAVRRRHACCRICDTASWHRNATGSRSSPGAAVWDGLVMSSRVSGKESGTLSHASTGCAFGRRGATALGCGCQGQLTPTQLGRADHLSVGRYQLRAERHRHGTAAVMCVALRRVDPLAGVGGTAFLPAFLHSVLHAGVSSGGSSTRGRRCVSRGYRIEGSRSALFGGARNVAGSKRGGSRGRRKSSEESCWDSPSHHIVVPFTSAAQSRKASGKACIRRELW
jgi:hypothetical protein